ncbi:hypothetical protein AB4225_29395 [Streptomyces sp. 2RAF24]|uniref:hypothetical protein n=1 Tax=Streptomyces sp. 2RAF24 TaxID=3232997 RepID=UPI003F9BE2C8
MTTDYEPTSHPYATTGPAGGQESELVRFARLSAEPRDFPESLPDAEEARLLAEEAVRERVVLAGAAAAGRRAAEWMRALPLPSGHWVRGALADAVEEAMRTLDPADQDDIGRQGQGGVRESVRETLGGLVYCLADTSGHLSPQRQAALLAVVSCVRDIPRLLASEPWGVVHHGDLTALCSVIDGAIASSATEA